MKRILKASAGTGKTYRLSLEYLAALLSGRDFREIAVLTFTRKATAEARERILEHMERLLEKGNESELREQLEELYPDLSFSFSRLESCYKNMLLSRDNIHIYTIDSFTNQLFGEIVAPYLGIFDYEIIEPPQNEVFVDEILRQLMQDRQTRGMLDDILALKPERDLTFIKNYINKIVKDRWKFMLMSDEKSSPFSEGDFVETLENVFEILQEIARIREKNFDDSWINKSYEDPLQDFWKLMREGSSRKEKRECLLGGWKKLVKKGNTFWSGNKVSSRNEAIAPEREELIEEYKKFQKQLSAHLFNQKVVPLESGIRELAGEVFSRYDDLKMRRQKFTYSDISNYVYNYLVNKDMKLQGMDLDSSLSRMAGAEITALFVDEFQDTSVLQWKILSTLLERDREFIAVGDAKQSIYQWRGGEKRLFVRLPQIISGKTSRLSTCYRSEESIVKFINELFSDLHDEWDYDDVASRPGAGPGYVEVLLGGENVRFDDLSRLPSTDEGGEGEWYNHDREETALDLPEEIARKIDENFESYKEVAVVARRHDHLQEVAGELAERGISYALPPQSNLLDNKAVWPLYQLLSYLWLGDTHYLARFLRSDLVKLPLPDLKFFLKHREQSSGDIVEAIINMEKVEKEDRENLSVVKDLGDEHPSLARILEWVADLKRADYVTMVEKIMQESNSFSHWQGDRGALKNLFCFYEMMREMDSLDRLMQFCRQDEDSPALQEEKVEGENAVDLLTIHRAKGLSLHTVFYYWEPAPPSSGDKRQTNLKIYVDFASDYSTIERQVICTDRYSSILEQLPFSFVEREEHEALMEEINNVYVAMTRASHNLFLMIKSRTQIKPDSGKIWSGASEKYNFYETALERACRVENLPELLRGRSRGELTLPEDSEEEIEVNLEGITTFFRPNFEKSRRRQAAVEAAADTDLDMERKTGRTLGQAIHYYLEHVTTGSRNELKQASRQVKTRYGNILGEGRTQRALKRAEQVVEDYEEYFCDRWQIFREYEPAVLEENEEGARIDRLLIDEEKRVAVILDFKSGFNREEAQLERYEKLIERELAQCGREDFKIKTEFIEV